MGLLERGLYEYVTADTTLMAQVDAVYHLEAKQEAVRPHIVYFGVSGRVFPLTLAKDAWSGRYQFSIFTDRTPAGRRAGLEIRDRLATILRSFVGLHDGNRVDRTDVTIGAEVVEDDQYHFPVDALPVWTKE